MLWEVMRVDDPGLPRQVLTVKVPASHSLSHQQEPTTAQEAAEDATAANPYLDCVGKPVSEDRSSAEDVPFTSDPQRGSVRLRYDLLQPAQRAQGQSE
jgi:hypothetical protein